MTSDNQLRNEWRSYKCSPEIFETVTIRGRNLQVAPPTIESWKALSEVMAAHQYEVRKSDTGSYNCRNISGTNTPSLHSYGIAVDVNWNTNPLKRTSDRRPVRYSHAQTQAARGDDVRGGRADTDMTPQMIADILAIKTKDGDRVFDWGGSWETIKDAMHFELDIGPSKLASGIDWSTVKGGADAAAGGVGSGTATDGAPASEDNANLKAYTVSSRDGLRLRAGSGTEFEVRAVMPYGTVIYELRREGKWSIIDRTGDGIADGSANNSFLTRTPDSDQPATGTLVPVGGGSQGSETASDFLFLNSNYTATDLQENPSLAVYLDVDYKPHKGWQIKESPGRRFTVTSEEIESPIAIGKSASYRYGDRGLTTVGLGRPWYDGTPGHVKFDPADWNEQFNSWPELLYPTAYAESGADFSVINAWDLAGFTVGFIQLAAHTSDDLIPFFKLLVASLAPEAEKYFPEFMLADGELCYRRAGGYRRLEVRAPAADPVPNDLVDRGLFMSFFNKDRQSLGQEELHAAARWLAWTQESVEMRRLQVSASIDNMRDSLSILHRALLEDARTRYPKGVDGMRCDHLAHLIHEAEGEELTVGDEAVGLA